LSWLRLAVILAVVGVGKSSPPLREIGLPNSLAVVVNFSLNPGPPSEISLEYHFPVGILFSINQRTRSVRLTSSCGIPCDTMLGNNKLFPDGQAVRRTQSSGTNGHHDSIYCHPSRLFYHLCRNPLYSYHSNSSISIFPFAIIHRAYKAQMPNLHIQESF
jgi:hypothetical protein